MISENERRGIYYGLDLRLDPAGIQLALLLARLTGGDVFEVMREAQDIGQGFRQAIEMFGEPQPGETNRG